MFLHWLTLASIVGVVCGQATSSWPHDYPGKPLGDLGPAWQGCTLHVASLPPKAASDILLDIVDFEVKDPLPNATFPVGRSFAGNIPVNRAGHDNDTLFFWAFESQNGSLTAENSAEPWGIWLNGG